MIDWTHAEDGTIVYFDYDQLNAVAKSIAKTSEFFHTREDALTMLEKSMHDAVRPLLQKPDHPEYNMATGGAEFIAIRAINGRIYVHVRARTPD